MTASLFAFARSVVSPMRVGQARRFFVGFDRRVSGAIWTSCASRSVRHHSLDRGQLAGSRNPGLALSRYFSYPDGTGPKDAATMLKAYLQLDLYDAPEDQLTPAYPKESDVTHKTPILTAGLTTSVARSGGLRARRVSLAAMGFGFFVARGVRGVRGVDPGQGRSSSVETTGDDQLVATASSAHDLRAHAVRSSLAASILVTRGGGRSGDGRVLGSLRRSGGDR